MCSSSLWIALLFTIISGEIYSRFVTLGAGVDWTRTTAILGNDVVGRGRIGFNG